VTTLKDNISKLMADARSAYDKAVARLEELTQGAAGG
jgi:hypothetical protein